MSDSNYKEFLQKITGMALILVGVIGLFLPFIQGIALILLGFSMLHNPTAERIIEKIRNFLRL